MRVISKAFGVVLILIMLITSGVVAPGPVFAQTDEYTQKIKVIQQRPFLRKLRVEIFGFAGMNLNEVMTNHFMAGGGFNFHFMEILYIGGNFNYYFYRKTANLFG